MDICSALPPRLPGPVNYPFLAPHLLFLHIPFYSWPGDLCSRPARSLFPKLSSQSQGGWPPLLSTPVLRGRVLCCLTEAALAPDQPLVPSQAPGAALGVQSPVVPRAPAQLCPDPPREALVASFPRWPRCTMESVQASQEQGKPGMSAQGARGTMLDFHVLACSSHNPETKNTILIFLDD